MAGGEAAHPADSERLDRYWTEGAGAAKIDWGVPGDFNRCVAEMRKVGVPGHMIAGHCANLHKRATGAWPGHAASEQGAR
jgi:hypothetical protein